MIYTAEEIKDHLVYDDPKLLLRINLGTFGFNTKNQFIVLHLNDERIETNIRIITRHSFNCLKIVLNTRL